MIRNDTGITEAIESFNEKQKSQNEQVIAGNLAINKKKQEERKVEFEGNLEELDLEENSDELVPIDLSKDKPDKRNAAILQKGGHQQIKRKMKTEPDKEGEVNIRKAIEEEEKRRPRRRSFVRHSSS